MKNIKLTESELSLVEALLHEHKGTLDDERNNALNDVLNKLNEAIGANTKPVSL